MLPAEKVDVVKRLQADGKVVAMVGDGVNDAAALAQADLGLAMGSGADVAIEASDLTLVRDDLRTVPDAIRLSRQNTVDDQGQLVLGIRLQRRRAAVGGGRTAQPDDRRCRNGFQLCLRREQQPAIAPVQAVAIISRPNPGGIWSPFDGVRLSSRQCGPPMSSRMNVTSRGLPRNA